MLVLAKRQADARRYEFADQGKCGRFYVSLSAEVYFRGMSEEIRVLERARIGTLSARCLTPHLVP